MSEEILKEEVIVKPMKHSGLSRKLNQHYHHINRGGTLKGEVMAGITMFLVAAAVLFMNIQMVASAFNMDVQLSTSPESAVNIEAAMNFARFYVGAMIMAFIGTLLMGIFAKLPFSQITMIGLGSSMLGTIGIESGLNYYNLLFINLIAAILYMVMVGVPKLREVVFSALPNPVKKALPVSIGLIFAYNGLKLGGFMGMSSTTFSAITPIKKYALVGAAITIVLYVLLKVWKKRHPVFWSLMTGTMVFILLDLILVGADVSNSNSFINFGRVWMLAASQASAVTPFGDSHMTYMPKAISAVLEGFTDVIILGSDFSEYSGNGLTFVIGGVLLFLFMGMYDIQGILLASKSGLNSRSNEEGKVTFEQEGSVRKALLANSVTNFLAPFFGVGHMTAGATSIVGTEDSGKSGLTAIVASIGYLISIFILLVPVLLATETYPVTSMNQWNYNAFGNGGFVYMMDGAIFLIVNVVMVYIGLSMAFQIRNINPKAMDELLPGVATVLVSAVFMNLLLGLLAGTIIYILTSLLLHNKHSQEQGFKGITLTNVILLILMAISIYL